MEDRVYKYLLSSFFFFRQLVYIYTSFPQENAEFVFEIKISGHTQKDMKKSVSCLHKAEMVESSYHVLCTQSFCL